MSGTPGFARSAWEEALGLGFFGGVLHAICETTLLGYLGAQPTATDLALFALTSVAAGLVLTLAIASILLGTPLRKALGLQNDDAGFRRILWFGALAGYVLLFVKVISFWSGWPHAFKLLALATPVLAGAGLAVFRYAGRARVCLAATTCVVAALCALQFESAAWTIIPAAKRMTTSFHMLIVVAACGAALMWAMKATPALVSPAVHSARVPYESIWRGTLFLAALAALWGALWLTVFSRPTALLVQERPSLAAPQRPGLFNVLLVVLDTVRADHLDLFDYQRETMPNLRRFARDECQVSMRIITTAPWTAPSHASMFTGLYASAHGAHYPFLSDESPAHVGYPLREDIPTLAEFLDAHGYRTAGIAANFVVLSSFGLLRGFEYSDASPGSAHLAATAAWLYRARFGKWPSPGEVVRDWLPAALQRRAALLNRRQPPYRRAREITDSAVRWLDGNADQPFFLFLNYLDAHTPYFPPAEDEERFASRPAGEEWLGFPHERYRARTWGRGAFTPEEEAFLIGQYDAQLFSLDREFGRLLQHLRDSGLMENTLILVTTDHGESLFEHDFLGHGATLYGPEINGFLLAKAPAGLGEIQPSPLMQFVDFFPTIAAAIGAPVPPHVQGSPWGHGRDYALSELFCRDCGYPTSERHEKFRRELVAVIREDRKLIRSTREPDEVYDLASDPGELKPLDELDAGFSERAEAVLRQRKIALLEEVTENQPTDEDLLKKMRTLGYVK